MQIFRTKLLKVLFVYFYLERLDKRARMILLLSLFVKREREREREYFDKILSLDRKPQLGYEICFDGKFLNFKIPSRFRIRKN